MWKIKRKPFRILGLALAMTVFACQTDSSVNPNVVSASGNISFEELVLLIQVKSNDSTYILTPQLDSITLFVNDQFWALETSSLKDTSLYEYYLNNEFLETNTPLDYLVLSNADQEVDSLQTAGEYAEYLNGIQFLNPGEYLCYLHSFVLRDENGGYRKYFPMIYKPFVVKDNQRSAFVGTFEFVIE